jgi:hypothetical protein
MSQTTLVGIGAATREAHVRILRLTQDVIRQSTILTQLPLDDAMTRCFEYLQLKLRWGASTTVKHAASIVGAWGRVTQYSVSTPTLTMLENFGLPKRPHFRDAMKTMTRAAIEQPVNFPKPLTRSEMVKIGLHLKTTCISLWALSICAWHSASRLGCLSAMEAGEITLSEEGNLDFRFRRGKSVTARRTGYHVFSALNINSEEFRLLRRFLNDVTTKRIWPSNSAVEMKAWGVRLRDEIRTIDADWGQRSYRRGAIQAMAQSGACTNSELCQLSGHSNQQMLRRYMSFGAEEMHLAKTMRREALVSIAMHCDITEP